MKATAIVLGALAALAYYKYSTMSDEQKRTMVGNLKKKGKKLYDDYVPDNVKGMMAKA
jgi:hypothetical protein